MAGRQVVRQIERGIRERRNQRGETVYTARAMVDGKAQSATFDTLGDARKWYLGTKGKAAYDDAIKTAIQRPQIDAVLGERTVANVLEWYRQVGTPEKAHTTQQSENRLLDKLLRHPIAAMPVKDVRGDHVIDMLKDMKSGNVPPPPANRGYFAAKHGEAPPPPPPSRAISDTSTYRFFSLLRVAFGRACEAKYVPDRNPCDEISRRALTGKAGLLPKWKSTLRDRRLQPGEGARLIAALKAGANAVEMTAFIRLTLNIPTRRGEWLGATWGQVDLTRGFLHTARKGHNRIQDIPLTAPAKQVLAVMLYQRNPKPTDKLFPGLTESRIRFAWTQACAVAGIENLRLHDGRHEAASVLASLGLSIAELQAFTGHKTFDSLLRYLHVRDKRELVGRVDTLVAERGIDTYLDAEEPATPE